MKTEFRCSRCPKTFARLDELEKHFRARHSAAVAQAKLVELVDDSRVVKAESLGKR